MNHSFFLLSNYVMKYYIRKVLKRLIFCRYACGFINCPEYGRYFSNKQSVYVHWQNKHIDSVENPVQCTFCPKKLVSTVMLEMHIKRSHGELQGKEYTCSTCGIVKHSLELLRSHEKTHQTGSFSCEFCDYKTYRKGNLKSHLR